MQISVFGRTDKRACIYTLMKILQQMGDVLVVTNHRHFTRLTEDGSLTGTYQNITVCVTDATADEMWQELGYAPEDFEYVILDNLYNEGTDLTIYVQGGGPEELDEYLFDVFEDMPVIHMGSGKNAVPYSRELLENIEQIEYNRHLVAPSPAMTRELAKILSKPLGLPAKTIVKVANKRC